MSCQSPLLSAAEGIKKCFRLMGKGTDQGSTPQHLPYLVISGLNLYIEDPHFMEEEMEAQNY